MQAMRNMNCSAIGISPFDLTDGSSFLEHLQEKYGIPFVSMNLIEKNSGRTIFKPYILKSFGDLSVAVLGITAVQPESSKNGLLRDLAVLSWEDTLPKILQEIGKRADMIILLSSFPEETNRKIAQEFEQIDIILQSGPSAVNRPVQITGSTLLAQTAGRGKYVGKIDISWLARDTWLQENGSTRSQDINARLDQVNRQLARMEKQDSVSSPQEDALFSKLQKARAEILSELKELRRQDMKAAEGNSTYRDSLIALEMSVPEDPEVQKILSTSRRAVYELNKKRMAEQRQGNVRTYIFSPMAGWQSCRSCHPVQTEHWRETNHAKAWETLAAAQQQFNHDCLICHVTLPIYNRTVVMQEGLIASLSPEFYGVGCEACHGPGKKHVDAPETSSMLRPTEETCTACHTPDHDDDFNFDRKLAILGCQATKE